MSYQIKLTPLSRIWTGDRAGECRDFRMTGFKGSLRWWYESLIRAMDTYGCDPTENGCILELTNREQQEVDKQGSWEEKCNTMRDLVKQKICPACYLFGCTGWKSRFGLAGAVQENSGTVPGLIKLEEQTETQKTYLLPILERTGFPLEEAELFLLDLLFSFISEHGSICGRMTLKPSEESFKNKDTYSKQSHNNYGLCSLKLDPVPSDNITVTDIGNFLRPFKEREKTNHREWADFRYFWYANKLLDREQINTMVNREPKKIQGNKEIYEYSSAATPMDRWMGGKQGISKKIFAFHTMDTKLDSPRVWGYVMGPNQQYSETNPDPFYWIKCKWPHTIDTLKWGADYVVEFLKQREGQR